MPELNCTTSYHAVACRSLSKHDIIPLINMANVCIGNKNKHDANDVNKYNGLLTSLRYTLGGDYPDNESIDHAELHAASTIKEIERIIKTKLSDENLTQFIKDATVLCETLHA